VSSSIETDPGRNDLEVKQHAYFVLCCVLNCGCCALICFSHMRVLGSNSAATPACMPPLWHVSNRSPCCCSTVFCRH
jgi:hypothetical protein